MFQAIFYALQIAVALILPIVCLKKLGGNTKSAKKAFFQGIYAYLIFGALLSSVSESVVETSLPMLSPFRLNPWLSALLSGIVLTLCLSIGRAIWVKSALKKLNEKSDALSFGAGSAFAATAIIYGLSGIVSFVFSIMKAVNSTKAVPVVFESTAEIVAQGTAYTAFLSTLQALLICALEICISAIFFTSLKKLSHKALIIPAIISFFAVHFFLRCPLELEIRLIICAGIVLLTSGICWVCTKKK